MFKDGGRITDLKEEFEGEVRLEVREGEARLEAGLGGVKMEVVIRGEEINGNLVYIELF